MNDLTLINHTKESGTYKPVPRLKKLEDQFYRYDGEPFTLTIYYRSVLDYKVFHGRHRLIGDGAGVFSTSHIIQAITDKQNARSNF